MSSSAPPPPPNHFKPISSSSSPRARVTPRPPSPLAATAQQASLVARNLAAGDPASKIQRAWRRKKGKGRTRRKRRKKRRKTKKGGSNSLTLTPEAVRSHHKRKKTNK